MSNSGDLTKILAKMESIENGTKFDPKSIQSNVDNPILDGNGRPVQHVDNNVYQDDPDDLNKVTDQMSGILGSMNDIFGTQSLRESLVPDEVLPKVQETDYTSMYESYDGEELYVEQYDDEGNYIPPVQTGVVNVDDYIPQQTQSPQRSIKEPILPDGTKVTAHVAGSSWRLLEEETMGLKSAKIYKIQNVYDSCIIIDNIMMYESAVALLRLLNDGVALSTPKILGIISSGLQYSIVMEDAIKYIKERKIVLDKRDYARAQELDTVISELKEKADKLKQSVISFLQNEGFM